MQNDTLNSETIEIVDFPPTGGIATPLLEKYSECDPRGNAGAYYWIAKNLNSFTTTFLLQTDSNRLPEYHPVWDQVTLGPHGEYMIPQCDKVPGTPQTFSFSISGLSRGNEPLWPKPSGNKSKDMPIIIYSKGIIDLANRHATRRLRVRYEISGQPEQNIPLDPNEYAPIGSNRDARIIDANYF